MSVIQGKSYWAKVRTAENAFDPEKPRYSIDVALTKAGVEQLKKEGVSLKEKDEYKVGEYTGAYVSMYKDQFITKSGKIIELPKPRVIDAQKNDISSKLIGNGSLVKVSYYAKEWIFAKKTGVRAVLKDVQVLDLIEYGDGDEFEEEEGYVSNGSANGGSTNSNSSTTELEFV